MNPMALNKLSFAWLVAALTACGCGGGDGLVDISGTVSFKGKTIPKGMIWFDPAPSHAKKPAQGFAFIEDGKFDSKANGRGVINGPYLVRVEGYDGQAANEFPYGKPLSVGNIEVKMDINPDGKPLTLTLK